MASVFKTQLYRDKITYHFSFLKQIAGICFSTSFLPSNFQQIRLLTPFSGKHC